MVDGGVMQQGGTGGVELEKRIEDVEKGLESMKNEFLRLSGESTVADKRLKALEESVRRHDESLHQLKETTIEMKTQYTSIMGKIDNLETKIFNLLTQGTQASAVERKFWMDLLKYVLGGTIFVIIGYIFIGGK